MTKITKEDVIKIAHMSNIKVHDNELDQLANQLQQVLSYAACVQEIAVDVQVSERKNINVLRDDVVVKTDSEIILACAPESEGHYFVVPAILDSTK
ncbi:MAG: Asp-tRNA(Asn)/Glu-tRNA(Gln) amidotransferase subunit GatC [Candidatus Dependentiae bacterium]|nr:Asp-tRNA(Asn)/Glu-tRNA(Gln) amidotransferase subunit GatC [Candidatus Dependentiae bacterium]